jgi:hypothetical protein
VIRSFLGACTLRTSDIPSLPGISEVGQYEVEAALIEQLSLPWSPLAPDDLGTTSSGRRESRCPFIVCYQNSRMVVLSVTPRLPG